MPAFPLIGSSRHIAPAMVVVLAAAFLFIDPTTMPIRLWDESRNIVNALEMNLRGFGIVTTYGGVSDLWNSKPPLLIWLMTASVRVFGPWEWALRLPSMIAALGTVLLVFRFVRGVSGRPSTAWLSAFLLVASPAMFGEHSARTADYDALLLFFVTAYCCLLFLALHRPAAHRLLALAGVAIGCAFLTKSVAAFVPGLGVAIHAIATGRWRRVVRTPAYPILGVAVAASVVGFLALREQSAPGYLAAAWANDMGGRFATSLVRSKARSYYVDLLAAGYFAATPLLVLGPVAFVLARGRERLLLSFSLSVVAATLVAFSCAASKLDHYILTAIPFMAIAAAITAQVLLGKARAVLAGDKPYARVAATVLALIATVPILTGAAGAIMRRYYVVSPGEGAAAGRYGALLERIVPASDSPVVVVDPGFVLDRDPHYAPTLLAYRELWRARGVTIAHRHDLDRRPIASPVLLASCAPRIVAALRAIGPDEAGVARCAALHYRVRA